MGNNKKSLMVTPEIFETYGADQKLNTLFHYVSATHDNTCIQNEIYETRFAKLEKRKLVDKGLAIGSGGVGGFLAVTFKWIAIKLWG
jgi:hypothetical protein